ncbi:hypothetical protein [Rubrivirga marina]|uniref:Uncharacterized protein n=1 Tax=Rubrivirga marina TaxID=1196024 RepID=A0A271J0S3_9BACT|nr:hypothetical protein [Rubrivirga marina]PAP76329.1 hypothetical protein BSZ37_07670 [Rubrivirga marina]
MPDPIPTAEVRVQRRLADADRIALDAHVATVREYQAKSVEAARALAAIMDDELYVETGTFAEFALATFGIRRRRAYQLAKAGRVYAEFEEAGVAPLPRSEAQLRPLTGLDKAADRRRAWERALETTGGDEARLTQEDVELAANAVAGVLGTGAEPLPSRLGLAALERELDGNPAPSDDLHRETRWALGLLDPGDEAEVWRRATHEADADTSYDAEGRLKSVDRAALRGAVRALATERGAPAPRRTDVPGGLTVLLERHLLDRSDTSPDATAALSVVGGSYLAAYAPTSGLVSPLVGALDEDDTDDLDPIERRDVRGRRSMARCRLEPEVAAWTWPVLLPGPFRSATSWFPASDAAPPCYVPARLTQPANTRPHALDLRLPTARAVLLAPGVDLLRSDLPDEVVSEILRRAGAGEHLAFLAATRHADRLDAVAWPPNVHPAIGIDGADDDGVEAARRALDAFDRAGVRGILVLDSWPSPLPDELLGRLPASASAVILRGKRTSRGAYDSFLGMRPRGLAFVAAADVPHRPWDGLSGVADDPEQTPERAPAPVTADLPRPSSRQ